MQNGGVSYPADPFRALRLIRQQRQRKREEDLLLYGNLLPFVPPQPGKAPVLGLRLPTATVNIPSLKLPRR
jgi:hypothetical protein